MTVFVSFHTPGKKVRILRRVGPDFVAKTLDNRTIKIAKTEIVGLDVGNRELFEKMMK